MLGLAIRMLAYAGFSALATTGLVTVSPDGIVSFEIESVARAVTGALGYAGTFLVSRLATVR